MRLNSALLRLAFASAPPLNGLTLPHSVTRRPVLQKVRDHPHKGLSLLGSIRFQFLFHSPPGVLFTFPSRYYTLSVNWSYLALGDGPPIFTPDFSCPVLLWILRCVFQFRLRGYYPVSPYFPVLFTYRFTIRLCSPKPHKSYPLWFGLIRVRSPLLTESLRLLSFPPLT